MGLFGFGKKKETEKTECCCGTQTNETSGCCCTDAKEPEKTECCCGSAEGITSIKVLGAGCKSCHELYENTKTAVSDMGLSVEVEYITDMEKVMSYGAMSMPALVVNENVASVGKVLKASEVEKLLHKLGF